MIARKQKATIGSNSLIKNDYVVKVKSLLAIFHYKPLKLKKKFLKEYLLIICIKPKFKTKK